MIDRIYVRMFHHLISFDWALIAWNYLNSFYTMYYNWRGCLLLTHQAMSMKVVYLFRVIPIEYMYMYVCVTWWKFWFEIDEGGRGGIRTGSRSFFEWSQINVNCFRGNLLLGVIGLYLGKACNKQYTIYFSNFVWKRKMLNKSTIFANRHFIFTLINFSQCGQSY